MDSTNISIVQLVIEEEGERNERQINNANDFRWIWNK